MLRQPVAFRAHFDAVFLRQFGMAKGAYIFGDVAVLPAEHEAGFEFLVAERAEFLRHAVLFALEGGLLRCGRCLRPCPGWQESGAERGEPEPEADDDCGGKSRTDADERAFHGGPSTRKTMPGLTPAVFGRTRRAGLLTVVACGRKKRPKNGAGRLGRAATDRPWEGN